MNLDMKDFVTIHHDSYLDRRKPEWVEYERAGLIKYGVATRVDNIDIKAVLIHSKLQNVLAYLH